MQQRVSVSRIIQLPKNILPGCRYTLKSDSTKRENLSGWQKIQPGETGVKVDFHFSVKFPHDNSRYEFILYLRLPGGDIITLGRIRVGVSFRLPEVLPTGSACGSAMDVRVADFGQITTTWVSMLENESSQE